ncbi:hypothetical protein P4493_33090 [Bacillus thuringiensis]|uniref:Uncharacterized protein n=1 Tax=Bacillus thuringiensis subsp. israelensis TaxID=1430 RepID=A0A160LKP2_BACTI|nr:hypothetical protein [Bacillus thuringiensis]MEC3434142.1 hypothetical protein [Bacillus cereus]AND28829.1 hypothetical protein ATN07_34545 [Bacillus thuringiensis serovar israelensis]KAA8477137.1 hypothetical protein FYW98_32675 [Bacillus thuringiensis]MCC4014676.1 hypothetical protein [Bacillus thuringiensis]MDV6360981.1 hypothetical protein [Bacillus thuringiensis]
MQQHSFLNFKEYEYLQIYSSGKLEGQGMYVGLFEDNNQLFLCWRNEKGHKIYTNINFISVERLSNNDNYDHQKYPNCNCDPNYND